MCFHLAQAGQKALAQQTDGAHDDCGRRPPWCAGGLWLLLRSHLRWVGLMEDMKLFACMADDIARNREACDKDCCGARVRLGPRG